MSGNFEQQLKLSLSPLRRPAMDEHPNADELNSFQERRLSAAAREAVMDHLAACADCREVVALAGITVPASKDKTGRLLPRWAAVAAALALIFAGQISRLDDGVANHLKTVPATNAMLTQYSLDRPSPVTYASADLTVSVPAVSWRVRNNGTASVVETSMNGGRTWLPVKLDVSFQPKEVGFKGPDVWVTGKSGGMLVSRDWGRRWVRVRPAQTR